MFAVRLRPWHPPYAPLHKGPSEGMNQADAYARLLLRAGSGSLDSDVGDCGIVALEAGGTAGSYGEKVRQKNSKELC